jgi:hypothetical protein
MANEDFENCLQQWEPNSENHGSGDSLPHFFVPNLVEVGFMATCKHHIQQWHFKVPKICIFEHNNYSRIKELCKKDNHHDHVCFL